MENTTLKHPQGKALSLGEKQILVNMVNYRVNQRYDSLSKIIQTVAVETGISEKTIYSVRKEHSSALGLQPAKRQSKNLTSLSRDKTYDEGTKSSIRRIVHDFFRKNTPPTLNILLLVNKDEHLPNFSRTTLHRLIKDMGFVYTKRDRKSMLIEKPKIISWRHRYLREIRTFWKQNYNSIAQNCIRSSQYYPLTLLSQNIFYCKMTRPATITTS
uniref:Uncharacterized protein LOC114344975 n=1 Tax=Diabrotica virgifera virgifera TaxID=50390 RepID=A0A6P7H1L0_DIAVI